MIFTCPSCAAPIGEFGGPTTVQLICSQCRFTYRIETGRLRASASRPVTVRSEFLSRPVDDRDLYEIHIELGDGTRRVVSFELDRRTQMPVHALGDLISVTYLLRRNAIEDLLIVTNHTAGTSYELATPGERSRRMAAWWTAGISTAAFGVLVIVNPPLAVAGTALTLVASHFGLRRAFAPTARLDPHDQQKLFHVHGLLRKKQDLEKELLRVEQDRARKLGIETRLAQLRAKMESVDRVLYQARIEQLQSAVSMLQEQIRLDDLLIDGYQRSVAILEIEVESSAHAGELPDDVAEVLRGKEEQLASIQRQNQDLELQLAANQEVERLLRGP